MINFTINGNPPSIEEINGEKISLRKRIRGLTIFACLLIVILISIATILGNRFTQSEYVLVHFGISTVLALFSYFKAEEIISSTIGIIYAVICMAYIVILTFITNGVFYEAAICVGIGTLVGFMSNAIIMPDLIQLKNQMKSLECLDLIRTKDAEKYCKADDQIKNYWTRILSRKRQLVQREYELIQEWVAEKKNKRVLVNYKMRNET